MKNNYDEYAQIFKTLSDATRLKILSMLLKEELCACRILEAFNITQPTLSYHMKMLTDIGLINAVKDGSWVIYSFNKKRKEEILRYLLNLLHEDYFSKR
ncbi:MAG: metalloregulator ArsR/SmtB family transcription factor [Bacilli bacterium]|nr:metalloregulator ArsR/SmtB family transcription factor [Bacilli bacterium]MDD4407101.1 metalloregulator ArsR/SmtB family transcription factor [Bacilli bacterium]